jgi:hypothetical protein
VSVFARVLKRIAVPNKIDYVFFKHGRAFPDWRLCYGPVESGNSPGPPTFTETFRFGKRQGKRLLPRKPLSDHSAL